MKDWYLANIPPNATSGYENDVISEYAQSNFTDVLETIFSDTVLLCNSDLTEQAEVKCIVQGNVANSQNKSVERVFLFPIGSSMIGKYIYFDNSYWLLTGYVGNNKSYEKIIGSLCNYLLKWQNSSGIIIERHAVISNTGVSNDGETGNNTITLVDGALSIKLPIDEESLNIKRQVKFFIDNNKADPRVYELTNPNNVVNTYGEHGVTAWIVKECAYSPTSDDLKYGVCNYIEPTPITPDVPTDETTILSSISYKKLVIRSGGSSQTYTAVFTQGGVEIDAVASWTITCDFVDVLNVSYGTNSILIGINDDSYIGETILLSVANENGEGISSVNIEVISLY